MSKMTFVLEFEDGKEPLVQFTEDFYGTGGRLCSAAFFDYKDDFLTEDEEDCIENILSDDHDTTDSWCEHFGVCREKIIEKLRLLHL